jgi:hypothetical protein
MTNSALRSPPEATPTLSSSNQQPQLSASMIREACSSNLHSMSDIKQLFSDHSRFTAGSHFITPKEKV